VGKGARNRAAAAATADDDMQTVLERMPWRGKFTQTEVQIFEARRERLVDAMTDAVGLFGQVMYTDPAHVALLAAHTAMAGDFFDDGHGRFIEYRIRDVETHNGLVVFEGVREWKKCGEFDASDPPPPPPAQREEMARAAAAKIREQLPPEVVALVAQDLAAEFRADMEKAEPTKKERAEGKLRERELRDLRKDND
jgi:hypothetical protein